MGSYFCASRKKNSPLQQSNRQQDGHYNKTDQDALYGQCPQSTVNADTRDRAYKKSNHGDENDLRWGDHRVTILASLTRAMV